MEDAPVRVIDKAGAVWTTRGVGGIEEGRGGGAAHLFKQRPPNNKLGHE